MEGWLHGYQPPLPAATRPGPATYSRCPHPCPETLGAHGPSSSEAECPAIACSPTPTFPLFLLTGEQGGQAVPARRGFRPLQKMGKRGVMRAGKSVLETGVLDLRV